MPDRNVYNEEPPKLNEADLVRVGRKLRAKFDKYKKDRVGTEQQWLKNLRQILGEYDPEVEQNLPSNRSRAYPRITRVKCASIIARLMSLLFPDQEKNWSLKRSVSPTLSEDALSVALQEWQEANPEAPLDDDAVRQAVAQYATKRAENLERQIDDQLQDISDYGSVDYPTLVRKVVQSAVHYSLGVLKGPMTIEHTEADYSVQLNEETGKQEVHIQEVTRYRPYYQFVPVWDYYPDMSAPSWDQMEGQFQRHVFSRHRLRALAERTDFKKDAILEFILRNPDGNYTAASHETERRTMGSHQQSTAHGSSKYEVLEYWGSLSGKDLASVGVDIPEDKHTDQYSATLWILGDVVIKAQKDPYPLGTRMYHQFVFEDDDVNLAGRGLPPIMRDSQMAVANAARMMMDNASTVCGPQLEVDYTRLHPSVDHTTIEPFTVWPVEGGASGAGNAVRAVKFDSHIDDLLKVIDTFIEFADTETFVGPLTGGDMAGMPSEPLRTTGGMSMALSSAALPFRDIVRNFDRFTVSVIHSLVKWNQIFNAHLDIDGDTRPVARGATTLMAKEIRAASLDQLANTMTEEEELYIDPEALVRHRLSSRDLPLDELLAPESVVKQRMEQRSQAQRQAQDQQEERFRAELQNLAAETFKATSQGQRNLDNGDIQLAMFVLDALKEGVNPDEVAYYVARSTGTDAQSKVQPGGTGGQDLPPGADEPVPTEAYVGL